VISLVYQFKMKEVQISVSGQFLYIPMYKSESLVCSW